MIFETVFSDTYYIYNLFCSPYHTKSLNVGVLFTSPSSPPFLPQALIPPCPALPLPLPQPPQPKSQPQFQRQHYRKRNEDIIRNETISLMTRPQVMKR